MPLDAPAPTVGDASMYSTQVPVGSAAALGGGGVGVGTGGMGMGIGAGERVGLRRRQSSGQSTPMDDDGSNSSPTFEDDFSSMFAWPRQMSGDLDGGVLEELAIGGERSNGGDYGGHSSMPVAVVDIVHDLVTGVCVYASWSMSLSLPQHCDLFIQRVPDPEHARMHARARIHAIGTCFTDADLDQKHREMIWGFMPAEARLLVETARQQLLLADKHEMRDQQGAFLHQTLLKVVCLSAYSSV